MDGILSDVCLDCPASMACVAGNADWYQREDFTLVVLRHTRMLGVGDDLTDYFTDKITSATGIPAEYVLGEMKEVAVDTSRKPTSWRAPKECPKLTEKLMLMFGVERIGRKDDEPA